MAETFFDREAGLSNILDATSGTCDGIDDVVAVTVGVYFSVIREIGCVAGDLATVVDERAIPTGLGLAWVFFCVWLMSCGEIGRCWWIL